MDNTGHVRPDQNPFILYGQTVFFYLVSRAFVFNFMFSRESNTKWNGNTFLFE